jgi:diguanylate cyclase (GGDEF)-like protein
VKYVKLNKASEIIRLRVALIIGACLVLGFMVADFILLPDAMHKLYIFDRLLLQLPIILIMVVASFWRQFANCKHYLFTFLLLSLTYSNYWLIWACWRDFQFVFPYEGTILYAFFCVFALGIPFKLAFFAATLNIVGFLSLMWAAPVYGDRVGISIAFVCASLFICAYAKYRLDRSVSLLEQSNDRLLKLSKFDPLSDLLNRRALRELSVKLLSVSKRHKVSMAVFMLDLDDFKKYNDSFGHQEGDEAIKLQADIMRSVFKRETDILGRYGGEEFIVVVSEVDKQRVVSLCNALLAQWKEAKLPHAKDAKHSIMSCSIGAVLATDVKDVKLDTLIDMADQALYDAKEKGKACFELQELA